MLAKILGGVSLLSASLFCYVGSIKKDKHKIEQIDAYIMLVEYIKDNVECYLLPIDRILDSCDKDIIKGCIGSSEYISTRSTSELYKVADIVLPRNISAEIERFCTRFGLSYKEEQVRMCSDLLRRLNDSKIEITNEATKSRKIKFALTITVPLFFILLFI